jgi:drug/metabolite transporter (DMT)-like permease
MVSLLIGIALAAGASTLYSLGIAVQALDARDVSRRHTLRISLLTHLVTRGRWLFGTGMTVLGWPLQILALAYAPLVVVQPALASGLLVLLVAGERLLGEAPGRRELASVAAIVAGVVGIAALAPGHTTHHVHGAAVYVVLSLLGVAAFSPFMLQLARRRLANIGSGTIANITMIGAGLGFAWSGLVNQFVADAAQNGHWGTAISWAAASATAAVVGLTCEMSALQRRAAILVAPVVFVVQTLIPVMLAPLVVQGSFLDSPLSGVPLLGCLFVLLGGATVIARSPALLAISGARDKPGRPPAPSGDPAQAAIDDSGSPTSPSDASASATRSSTP